MNTKYIIPEGGSAMCDLSRELDKLGYKTHLYDGEFKTLKTPTEDGCYYKWLHMHLETAVKKYDMVKAGDVIELTSCGIIVHRGDIK